MEEPAVNPRLKQTLLVDGSISCASTLLVLAMIGVPLLRLEDHRDRVRDQQQHIADRLARIEKASGEYDPEGSAASVLTTLEEASLLSASEVDRIAEMAAAAKAAGVDVLSLRSEPPRPNEDAGSILCDHHLVALGSYQGIAALLDGLVAARGICAVQDLEIERFGYEAVEDDESLMFDADGDPPQLRVRLTTRWFAPNAEPMGSEEQR